jgi:hypothetical protein
MASLDALIPMSVVPKPFLLLCSKPLAPEDQAIFSEFGMVVTWADKYINMPLSQITPFDYLLCDMNSKNMRLTLGRTDLSQYNVVGYVSYLQKMEDFVEQLQCTVITSVPPHAVNKADFDMMLLNEKLVSPSMIKSALKWVFACLKK